MRPRALGLCVLTSLVLSAGLPRASAGAEPVSLSPARSLELGAPAASVTFSADASFFLVTVQAEGHSHVARVSVGTWAVTQLPLDVSECYPLCLSPDGRLLVYGLGGTVRVVDTTTYQELLVLPAKPRAYAFSPDGALLAAVDQTDRLRMWDVSTWREVRSFQITCAFGKVRGLAFAADGNTLVTFGATRIATWALPSRNAVRSIEYPGPAALAQVMPDGRWLAVCGDDGMMRVIDLGDARQTASVPVHSLPTSLRFAPNAPWTLCVDSAEAEIAIHSVLNGARVATLAGNSSDVRSAAVCPSGRYVVSVSGAGRVCVWDVLAIRLPGVRSFEITAVDWPSGSVTITNRSGDALDLLGWTVTDGGMSHTFRTSLWVPAGESCIIYPYIIGPGHAESGGAGGAVSQVTLLAPQAFGGAPVSTHTR